MILLLIAALYVVFFAAIRTIDHFTGDTMRDALTVENPFSAEFKAEYK